MADPNYIMARHHASQKTPFPLRPMWDAADPCAGVAYLGAAADTLSGLSEVRGDIVAIWEGRLPPEKPLLIVQFSKRIDISHPVPVTALPLQVIRPGLLASFSMDQTRPKDAAISRATAVQIWWKGKSHYLRTDALTPLSLARLWPRPSLNIYHSFEFERIDVPGGHGQQIQTGTEDPQGEAQGKIQKRVKVKTAKTNLGGENNNVFSDTDRALARLEEDFRLRNIFSRLFKGRSIGKDGRTGGKGGSKKGAGSETKAGQPPQPGVFESLAGWVRWHTPLGSGLMKQFGDRMSLVDKLINKGDIDSALKLALKLGRSDKGKGKKSRFPLRLPDMRSGLDFDTSSNGFSMPILGLQSQQKLKARYTALAAELEQKGDFRRAAYIRSQLLDDHLAGVLTLERGEMFDAAAKLALDSRQDPVLIIRLFYKAGKKDTALALAKRTDCFAQLVEDSRARDPEFHGYVVKAWTDMLLAADKPLRALEVTDTLARGENGQSPDQRLLDERRIWLAKALDLEARYSLDGSDIYRPELLARMVLNARWDAADLAPSILDNFPNSAELGPTAFGPAFAYFQDIVKGSAPEIMIPLLSLFAKEANRSNAEQSAFWEDPARVVMDRFARNLLAYGSNTLIQRDMKDLQRLVQIARLPVLGADLSKIKTFNKPAEERPNVITLAPPPESKSAKIMHACILSNGSMVVWYDTDRLELRNAQGLVLWTRQVSRVQGLVPMGSSPSVLVVQAYGEFETRLTRFETHKRRFTDIGILHLVAWHDVSSDGQWLVQIDNQVGAIDLQKLSLPVPDVEFLWSVETSNDMKIMAFLQTPFTVSWLTRNMSKVRFGVMQIWTYLPSGDLEAHVCIPGYSQKQILHPEISWQWTPLRHVEHGILGIENSYTNNQIYIRKINDNARRRAIAFAQERNQLGYTGTDSIQVCDFGRLCIDTTEKTTLVTTAATSGHRDEFTLVCSGEPDLRLLARGANHDGTQKSLNDVSHLCLCTDAYGRLLRINTVARRVDIL